MGQGIQKIWQGTTHFSQSYTPVDRQSICNCSHSQSRISHTYKSHQIHHHYVQEKLEHGVIDLQYCPTADQIADIFTKPLPIVKHSKFVKDLSII